MRLLLQCACGLPIDPQPPMDKADGYAAVAAIIPNHYGRIKSLPVSEHIRWAVTPGEMVHPLEHNAQRCGYVMAHRATQQAAWQEAQTMVAICLSHMEIDDHG